MTYVVTENCIRCKYMDCVEVCPVDCFYVGANMLVIHPDECIDCGVCEPECPGRGHRAGQRRQGDRLAGAQPRASRRHGRTSPARATPPADADDWKDKPGKAAAVLADPGEPG